MYLTLIGLVLAAVPIAAIAAIVWVTRLAARPIRPVRLRVNVVQQNGTVVRRDSTIEARREPLG